MPLLVEGLQSADRPLDREVRLFRVLKKIFISAPIAVFMHANNEFGNHNDFYI